MTLMGFSFCSWMRIQFSSDSPPRLKAPWRVTALPVQVVQCVHEAQVGELQVAAGPLLIGVLDVQVGDVVGQDGHFVSVDFVEVLVLQPVGGKVVDQVGDEGAGPGGRVQDLHVVIGQGLAEVLLQQVVSSADDEVHHLVGGVDHPQPVGGCRIVGGVEVLVDGLEELLLLGVVGDIISGSPDCPVVCS